MGLLEYNCFIIFRGVLLPHFPGYRTPKPKPQKPKPDPSIQHSNGPLKPVFINNNEIAFPDPDHIVIPVPQLFRLPGVEVD